MAARQILSLQRRTGSLPPPAGGSRPRAHPPQGQLPGRAPTSQTRPQPSLAHRAGSGILFVALGCLSVTSHATERPADIAEAVRAEATATQAQRRPDERSTRSRGRDQRPLAIPGHPPPPRPATPAARPPQPPPQQVVTYRRQPAVIYRPRPSHGVFVYGARPAHHTYYRETARPAPQPEHLPKRLVSRKNSLAIGVRGGSLVSGYRDGTIYGDFGLGLLTRYRPTEALGLELAVDHHNESWGAATERAMTVGQASGVLYIVPWGRLSPYVLAGMTVAGRHVDDKVQLGEDAKAVLFGPHGGAGLEIALGNFAIDLDGRFIAFVNLGDDRMSQRGAFQANAALVAHF